MPEISCLALFTQISLVMLQPSPYPEYTEWQSLRTLMDERALVPKPQRLGLHLAGGYSIWRRRKNLESRKDRSGIR